MNTLEVTYAAVAGALKDKSGTIKPDILAKVFKFNGQISDLDADTLEIIYKGDYHLLEIDNYSYVRMYKDESSMQFFYIDGEELRTKTISCYRETLDSAWIVQDVFDYSLVNTDNAGTKLYKHSIANFTSGPSTPIISKTALPYTKISDIYADINNIINNFIVGYQGAGYLVMNVITASTTSGPLILNTLSINDGVYRALSYSYGSVTDIVTPL